MTGIRLRCGNRLLPRLVFALCLLVTIGVADAAPLTAGPSESALVDSAKLVRAAVTQTNAAIASRVHALSSGQVTSPLALAPDRHVRLLALGNAGRPLPSQHDARAHAVAEKAGIPMPDAPFRTPLGIWVDGAWSRLRFDDNGASFDGDMWSGLAGIDYALSDRLVLGLAGGYESQNLDISTAGGGISGSGVKMAPYAVYRLDDNLSLDLSGGYAWLTYDESLHASTTAPWYGGGADAGRWFAASDLNAIYRFDAWRFDSRLGALYADDGFSSSLEPEASGSQVMAVGDLRLGYRLDWLDGVEPYVSALCHLNHQDSADDTADAQLGIGARLDLGTARLELQGTSLNTLDAPAAYAGQVKLAIGL